MAFYGSLFFNDVLSNGVSMSILKYHGYVMMVMILVIVVVLYMGVIILNHSNNYRNFKNSQAIEFWWTVLPVFMLLFLWCPSILNLYRMEDTKDPIWSFKAVGKQWYWSYEVMLKNNDTMILDSYMLNSIGFRLVNDGYRLLDVDNRLVAPANTQISCYVCSSDVLHSFALPSVMLKVDAIPGRVNVLPMKVDQSCIIYGQCSEICGVNHSFMPIVIEFVPVYVFLKAYEF
nr:cytochrome c oxidase subunit II [Vignadula atrata]